MKTALRYMDLVLLFVTVSMIFLSNPAEAGDDEEVTLVGRISHVEGKLLRYIEEENDWVLTVKDAPFGLNDALYSGDYGKAEFMMSNRTWLRTGENTQVQLIDLNPDATTVDVASGLARLYNKSEDVVIKVTTPFGYVVAPGGTVFDLYVGDVSLEVIAVDGDVDFVHSGTNARYEVLEGYSSIIADEREVTSGNATVDAVWDDWNRERDELWETRLRRSQYSAGYLPESIREESYSLEENGRWERIYYEGDYRDMWRPTRVERGWRPFTAGRWTVYYGDNCWVPDEPFGYVTHHYGSWIYVETQRTWFWLPPAARIVRERPRFFISFGWHPGRVGWIHSGPSIGWVPLAWDEEYYGHRHWGPRTVIVRPYTVININIYRYRFLDEAVVIPRDRFYRGSRYTQFVQRDVNRDIIVNNYRPVTVINNTVINNFTVDKRRFAYNDAEVDRKPHVTVVNRINANQKTISKIDRIGRERIERDLTRVNVRSKPPAQKTDAPRPVLTTKLVEPDNVAKPITTLDLEKKEIKPRERERQVAAGSEERRRSREQARDERIREKESREEGAPRKDGAGKEQVVREQDRSRQPGEEPRPAEELERQQAEEARKRREPQRPAERKDQAEKPQQVQEPGQTEEKPRLRSPREKGEEVDRGSRPQDRVRQPEAGPQDQEIKQQQAEEARKRREPQRPAERKDQAEKPQRVQEPERAEEKPQVRSPRDRDQEQATEAARKKKEDEGARQQDQVRQQKENQQREQQKIQLQQQEDDRRRGEQQARQRQEERDKQQQQAAEAARQKKEDENARQQEQVRQQKENQQREQQKIKQQQQAAEAARQKKEAEAARQQEQVRQQKENQQREQQKIKQQQQAAEAARQKKEVEAARQQEQARQQKENQQREQQKIKEQQQVAEAARKKKEVESAPQQEQARQEKENQPQEGQKRQPEKKKKKNQEEEQQPPQ